MSQSREKAPLRIGLTGGIASGKSLVAKLFSELGVPVIDTDIVAREVVEPGRPALAEIAASFGEHMIAADGHLDRAAMRKAVFANEANRLALEAILHPRIGAETRRQAATAGGAYQLIVVPLLLDSRLRQFVDRVLVVDCEEDTQIQRLLARDDESIEQARRILAAQASRQDRLEMADDIVHNDHSIEAVRDQVLELDRKYRLLAES